MKRLFGMFMAFTFFTTTTVFAGQTDVRSMVRDYQVKVRVQNVDGQTALKDLTQQMLDENVTTQDLIDYVKTQSSPEDFEQFVAMLELGNSQITKGDKVDFAEFQQILSEVFASSQVEMGANYASAGGSTCGTRSIGYVVIAVGVVLGIVYLQRRMDGDSWLGNILDFNTPVLDVDASSDLSDNNLMIATAISAALGIYMVARC